MRYHWPFFVAAAWFYSLSWATAAPPTAADDRLLVELVAREPDIVTPTGVAVDERGRIWAIENHTHQRPNKYKGPPSDRIRIFEDFGHDGKARKITTWAEGLQNTMGIAFGKDGAVFVATRSAIYLLRDSKSKEQADEKLVLARLDTDTTYPHNGLSGFAIDALGELYFGLGENFGASYKLIGSDKTTLTGGGEGGSIYRMKPDGSGLTRVATGFWNPFHMAFDRLGRHFAVDNDPDARGPCRLLHIVQGGDYGYRFKYGRKGIHPFQSWNGELPGTLPMVAGTAEAPSGIVAYESDGLPDEYRSHLLVTSWGDHVIEQFNLEPRGASFGAKKKIIVRGGQDFRPVGIAIAPDGSLIVSDWVDQSYPVHGKGRIWRIRAKDPLNPSSLPVSELKKLDVARLKSLFTHPRRDIRLAAADTLASREKTVGEFLQPVLKGDANPLARLHALWALVSRWPAAAQMALADEAAGVRAQAAALCGRLLADDELTRLQPVILKMALEDREPAVRLSAALACGKIRKSAAPAELLPLLGNSDPFIFCAAVAALANMDDSIFLSKLGNAKDARMRLGALLVQRQSGSLTAREKLPGYLDDADPAIRRAAIQWVAEEGLAPFAPLLDKVATKVPVSRELFEAWLAAKELLAKPGTLKNPNKEPGGDEFVLKIVGDAKQPAAFRAMALRMLRPDHPKLKVADLIALTKDKDDALRAEAIKTLAWRKSEVAQEVLREVAKDESLKIDLRRDAVLGLSKMDDDSCRLLLFDLTFDPRLAADAMRSLRGLHGAQKAQKYFFDLWSQQWQRDKVAAEDFEDLAEHAMLSLLDKDGAEKPPATLIKLTTPRPATIAAWRQLLLKAKGDPVAGERVFFHANGPRCFACHRIDGRGEAVGPDLSRIGAATSREKLLESILEPSKEIAPAFVTWLVTMRDGKQHIGVIAAEGFDSTLTLADGQGKRTVLKITDIEDRVAQKTSIMPADLHTHMTRREFADLLAFLEGRK